MSKYLLILFSAIIITIVLVLWLASKSSITLTQDQHNSLLLSSSMLAFLVAGSLTSKIKFKELIKNLSIWIVIFLVVIIGYSFQNEAMFVFNRVKMNLIPGDAVSEARGQVIIRQSKNGHFMVNVEINGQVIYFMVDTGATDVSLSAADATKIGLDINSLNYNSMISTANGINYAANITLPSVKIGDIIISNVQASVVKSGLSGSLLGMSFLNRLKGFSVQNDMIIFNE